MSDKTEHTLDEQILSARDEGCSMSAQQWRHEFKARFGSTIILDARGAHIATVHRDSQAPLIAAAPDLLKQCKRALDAWTGDGPAILLDDLRAAIARATGART